MEDIENEEPRLWRPFRAGCGVSERSLRIVAVYLSYAVMGYAHCRAVAVAKSEGQVC